MGGGFLVRMDTGVSVHRFTWCRSWFHCLKLVQRLFSVCGCRFPGEGCQADQYYDACVVVVSARTNSGRDDQLELGWFAALARKKKIKNLKWREKWCGKAPKMAPKMAQQKSSIHHCCLFAYFLLFSTHKQHT